MAFLMRFATFGLAFAAVGVAQAQVILDDFTTGPDQFSVTSGVSYYGQTGTMVGGYRGEALDIISNPFSVPLDVNILNGFSSVSEGSDMYSDVSIAYGYLASADHSSLSTFDLGLNLSGENGFQLNVAYNQTPMAADIMLNNNIADVYAFTIGTSATPVNYDVAFSNFSGVDFSDIHQISINFTDSTSNDFTLGSFVAAPEPVSVAFLGLGVIGLIARSRRK